jgi:very-short-patch-repair endonuclease
MSGTEAAGFDIDAFARAHEGRFGLAEAARAGWDASMRKRLLESGRTERVHDGVFRFRGATDSWRSRALAAAWAGGDLCGVSHRSAARPTVCRARRMETDLLQTLRAHGLPEPELQFELRDSNGIVIATVDAALTKWQILLEYDSREHHSDETDEDRDNRRREWAAQYGYWLIPVRYLDLKEGGHELARAIRGAINRLEGRVPASRSGAERHLAPQVGEGSRQNWRTPLARVPVCMWSITVWKSSIGWISLTSSSSSTLPSR